MAKKKQESKRASKRKKLPEVYNKLLKVGAYDATHRKQLQQRAKKVQQLYKQAVDKIARAAAPSLFDADPAKEFHFSDFPALNKSVDEFIDDMGKQLQANIEDGDSDAWTLANAKNDMVVNTLASVYSLPKETLKAWRHPHLDALQEFEERRKSGMNLSNGGSEADIHKGVWNLDQFKNELELALEQGIGQGKSAVDLSRDVRQYLKYPNKLFRRVRDKDGVLRLSKAAAAFHPGRGVYRSSYKNALRLTATENNIAYRTCDHKRWNALPFVLGQEIKTSNNHPEPDICDTLAGKYPIEFKFTGWHPFCRCYAVSILANEKELDDYCSKLEQGTDVSEYLFAGKQTQMPEAFTTWMKDNEQRIANAKNMPYFIKDNYKDGDPAKGLRWECKNKQSTQWEPSFMNEEQYTELTRTMKITPEQHHELYDGDDVYIDSSWSRQINKELASEKVRGDIPDNFMDGDTGTIRQCKVLDAVIKANTLKEDTYVYRKVTEDWLKRDGVSFTEGNVIHEFGYTSTSAVEGNTYMSRKTVRMNIKIPKGTHAYVSENINESEIILGRNSKFLVKSVKHEGKNTIINLELQPQIVKSVKTKHEVIMENADKRHAARTQAEKDAIMKRLQARRQKHQQMRDTAQLAMEQIKEMPEVSGKQLAKYIKDGDLDRMYKLALKKINEVNAMKLKEQALEDLIPDVHEWHKKFKIKELEAAHDAVKKKLSTWDGFNNTKKLKKLEFEIDYITKHPKYITDEVAQAAYKKRKNTVEFNIKVEGKQAQIKGLEKFKTKSKIYTDLITKAKEELALTTEANQNAQLKKVEETIKNIQDKKEQLQNRKGAKVITQARRDKAVWDKGDGANKNTVGQKADKVLRPTAMKAWAGATQEQRNMMYEYTMHYKDKNEPLELREYQKPQTRNEWERKVNLITDYIETSPLPKDMWFQRGDDAGALAGRLGFVGNKMPADIQALVGMELQEGGFMSAGSGKWKGFVNKKYIFNIFAPKGTKAAYAEPFSEYGRGAQSASWDGIQKQSSFSQEFETIFQRGTKMKITKVEETADKVYIDVDIIGQEIKDLSYVSDDLIGW